MDDTKAVADKMQVEAMQNNVNRLAKIGGELVQLIRPGACLTIEVKPDEKNPDLGGSIIINRPVAQTHITGNMRPKEKA